MAGESDWLKIDPGNVDAGIVFFASLALFAVIL